MAHILLAEDDWLHREFLTRLLKIKGYEVTLATHGQEAVDLAREIHPNIIIMDIGMPVMDGLQAIGILRADPQTNTIPIIVLSAFALHEDRDRAYAAGCDRFETKPVDFENLQVQIQQLVARTE